MSVLNLNQESRKKGIVSTAFRFTHEAWRPLRSKAAKKLCIANVELSFVLRAFREALAMKLRQSPNEPPLGSTEGDAPSASAFASTSNSRGERSTRRRRRRGSPMLFCWNTYRRRSTRAIRPATDPATHRFEQFGRAPFVVAIASVSPPGGPYRWRRRKGASPVCLSLKLRESTNPNRRFAVGRVLKNVSIWLRPTAAPRSPCLCGKFLSSKAACTKD